MGSLPWAVIGRRQPRACVLATCTPSTFGIHSHLDGVGRLEERDFALLRLSLVNGIGYGAFDGYERRRFLASNYGAQPRRDESLAAMDNQERGSVAAQHGGAMVFQVFVVQDDHR